MKSKLQKLSLLAGDVFILYLSLYLTLCLRYLTTPNWITWSNHFNPFTIAFAAWLLIFYISDLYNIHIAINNSKFFNLTIRSVIFASLLSASFFYLNPFISIAPKRNLLIYLVIFTILFISWRRLFNTLLFSYFPKEKLVIIGYNKKVKELAKILEQKPHLGYKISLIVGQVDENEINSIPTSSNINELSDIIKNQKISTIILASDPNQSDKLRASLFPLLHLKTNFISLPNFYEQITGKVPIDAISEMWFLENLSEGNKRFFDLQKRIYDIALALIMLALTWPLWIIIAIAIKLESKGPAFFVKEGSIRLGQNNKTFKTIKFRTMREEGNDRKLTVANDPRITKLGSFLRKTRLDELPQVINILRGELSFVGPRPERPVYIKELEKQIPFYHERLLVKPGLTGWDQVSGQYHSPSVEDTLKKLQYDLFYIKNRSLYLDVSIILKTIAIVLKRGGV